MTPSIGDRPASNDASKPADAPPSVDPTGDADPPDGTEVAPDDMAEVESERPPAAGPVANIVAGVLVTVLGAASLVGSLSLGAGSAASPRPGTWPALVSAGLIALGLTLIVRARTAGDAERYTSAALLVLAGVATMVVYVVMLPVVGFEIPTALLAFVWLRYLGREGWRISIVVSLGATAAFYALFVGALDVAIPHLF
ncbi:tripartite tricarboxylate transporter TctB family protein [Cryptosporangium minutisporangium]|uniref:Tripartite tricarboxylate transporter TctB family protein n=1 Tax=Cryptosporangium minutisporangium TaxID=113569 RepID=A0ABP6SYT0_9ACTN